MNMFRGTKHTVPVVLLLLVFTLMCSLNAAAQWLGANNIADRTTNTSDKSGNAKITAVTTAADGSWATYTANNSFTTGAVVTIPASLGCPGGDATLCGTFTVVIVTATTFTVNGTFTAGLSGAAFSATASPVVFDPVTFYPGETFGGDTGCMQCHSSSPNMPALYPNPLTVATGVIHDFCSADLHDCGPLDANGYLMTGHKNMLRKVLPTQAQDGAPMAKTGNDGLTYSAAGFDWAKGTYKSNSLLYVLGWLPSEEAPYLSYLNGDRTATTGNGINLHGRNMDYSCGRCHTTGYSFDASGPEPTMSNADGTYTPLTDAQFPRTPSGWASGTKTASWYLTGIQCERCHGSSHTDCSAVGVTRPKIGGQTVTDCNAWQDPSGAWHVARSHAVSNVAALALCIECHRQERTDTTQHLVEPAQLPGQNLSGWPAIPGANSLGAVSDSGKCSDASSRPYSECIAAGLTWNFTPSMSHGANGAQTFLNSPHARFTGTLELSAQNSPDLSVKLNGTFSSAFSDWGEGLGTANSNNAGCTGCHNPHYSAVATNAPDVEPTPIVKQCQDCHKVETSGYDFSIKVVNHPTGAGTPLPNGLSSSDSTPCVVCHMGAASGQPTYHYFRINEDPTYYTFGPASVWYAKSDTPGNGQPNTYAEPGLESYPAVGLDVDIACGQCHVGGNGATNTYSIAAASSNAPMMSRAELAMYAKGIHATFLMTAPSSATGTLGQPLNINVTLTPRNGVTAQNPVTLSVSGLPANATSSWSANPVIPVSGGVTSTLTITVPVTTAQLDPQRHSRPFLALFLPMFGIAIGSVVLGGNKKKRALWVVLGLVLLVSLAGVGCGGGGGTPATSTAYAQSFTVTVNATSGPVTVSSTIPVTMN